MLVTDLDGTLLGDDAALRRFHHWVAEEGAEYVLVYATGRTASDVSRLVMRGELPAPDYTVGALGTELYEHVSNSLAAIGPRFGDGRWDPHHVRRALARYPEIRLQPDEFQSQFKASFYLESAAPKQLAAIDAALADARIHCERSYSGDRYLDVLPRGVSKGATARLLATKLSVPLENVVACGDSGNDVSLFGQGFRGVLVGNAEAAMLASASEDVYRSALTFADGVLDGLRYWQKAFSRDAAV
jgi:sucrose-6F-phosphate phosphohydrolase